MAGRYRRLHNDRIKKYIASCQYPPTVREVAEALRMNYQTAWYHIDIMCDIGELDKERYRIRTLKVTPE
jgi:LexA DNA binding domain-containing protein